MPYKNLLQLCSGCWENSSKLHIMHGLQLGESALILSPCFPLVPAFILNATWSPPLTSGALAFSFSFSPKYGIFNQRLCSIAHCGPGVRNIRALTSGPGSPDTTPSPSLNQHPVSTCLEAGIRPPDSGTKSSSPALAGVLLTTEPTGKTLLHHKYLINDFSVNE